MLSRSMADSPYRSVDCLNKLVLTSLSDDIGSIRLNRPEALNTLIPALAEEFREAVQWASVSGARVIVLSGVGRAFCAGGDLAYLKEAVENSGSCLEALIEPMHAAIQTLRRTEQPVVVSLQGGVAGAGMSLALSADLAIAADNTVFALAYSKLGVTLDCGGSWYLPRLVGTRHAMEIALLGDRLDAQHALRLGLVNWVVPVDALEVETARLARRLADISPTAARGIKALMKTGLQRDLPEHLEAEKKSFLTVAQSAGFSEALSTFSAKSTSRH
jgi:2-(1,2-epoxy-1,2-dihydrophenyl)acetyl-CoA isomerase